MEHGHSCVVDRIYGEQTNIFDGGSGRLILTL
jgi:hypothetical protein